MKLTAESTNKIVELVDEATRVAYPARVWEAVTEAGVKCHLYVTRVAVAEGQPESVYETFKRELSEQRKAMPEIQAIPLRLIV